MVEFIARGYEPRKKTEKQQPANCRVGWPNKGWSKEKNLPEFQHCFIFSIWCIKRRRKKGEELLDAKGRDMRFLHVKLAMSKMSSIISVMGMNVNPSTAISQMIHIFSYHIPF